jgi:RND family efflux transporter MFP subunit
MDHPYRYYIGGVEAEEYTNLSFPLSAPLIRLNVEMGQQVVKGMEVAAIDPLVYQSEYESKQVDYLTAQSQLERNRRLLAMQAVSLQEYELSESAYVQAKTAYEIALRRLNNTRLLAPFDGYVTQKYVENYQRVQAGETVVRLMSLKRMEIIFLLPETSVGYLQDSLDIAVEFDRYPGKWFKTEIKEVVDASLGGYGVPIRLRLTDFDFQSSKYSVLPGFSCRVRLEVHAAEKMGFQIPLSAVWKDLKTGNWWVWRYDTHLLKVFQQAVKVEGLVGQADVFVVSGLKENDWIVVAGGNYLVEGETVHVITD